MRRAPARTVLWPIGIVALAALELAWFSWFLTAPLPNSAPLGGTAIRRSLLLWRALPGVVPGFPLRQSYLYLAARELRHVENLPQRVPIVLAAGLIAASAVALGQLVLRGLRLRGALSPWERIPIAFGLGTVGLGLVTLGLGRLGWLNPWLIRIGLVVPIAVELALRIVDWSKPHATSSETDPRTSLPGPTSSMASWALSFAVVAGPFLLITLLGSMLPTYDYDAIEYHLQGPKEYYLAGRIAFLEHNVYTSMPFGVEMLHLLGMEVVGDWWWGALVGQLLVALFAPAAAAMVALTAWRWGSPRAAWVAAVVYLSTPWIYRLGNFPYVEGPLCYFHAALVWAAGRAWAAEPARRTGFWGLVGLLAGGAMACKYPGLVSAVVPFGLVALAAAVRQGSWRPPVAFGLGVVVVIGPWLVKNVVDTGNPVYPLAYRLFGGRHWSDAQDVKWSAAHGPRPISARALADNIVDVAGRSDWQSPLYTALVPLAFLRRGSRRLAWALAGYAAYIFLTWWLLTHRLDRFWLPLLPPAAVLAGLGADWVRGRAWTALLVAVLALGLASNLVYDSTALAGFNQWTGDLLDLRSRVPRDVNPPLARLDDELPPGATVLLVGQAAVFHMRHPVVYNTVFNQEILETLARGRSPAAVHRDLVNMGVDYVYADWNEIKRFRSAGNYGFTAFITPELFDGLVAAGVLEPRSQLGLQQQLYRVRPLAGGSAAPRE